MKIILTTHVFLPEFFGGTETLVHAIGITLKQKGHSVTIVTGYPEKDIQNQDDYFDEYEIDSIRVVRFRHSRTAYGQNKNVMLNDYANPLFESGFLRLLDEIKPDIVHFHHLERLSIKAVDACVERGISIFLTVTDFWYVCPTHALLLSDGKICDGPEMNGANCIRHLSTLTQPKWISTIFDSLPLHLIGLALVTLKELHGNFPGRIGQAQALARRGQIIAERISMFHRIFVPARFTQKVLENNGIRADRFRVLPFGIKDYGYIRRVRQTDGNRLILGFIGALMPHKGLHILLDAMKLLANVHSLQLRIYGSAPHHEMEYVKKIYALAQGDERIIFCGTFENSNIPHVLDEMDVLVIPSLWHENMPLVSLSAKAAACPLIASNIGGLSDMVVNDNGLLFTPGSAYELSEAILRFLSDSRLLTTLSSAIVPPMKIDQYVGELETEYHQSCGDSN